MKHNLEQPHNNIHTDTHKHTQTNTSTVRKVSSKRLTSKYGDWTTVLAAAIARPIAEWWSIASVTVALTNTVTNLQQTQQPTFDNMINDSMIDKPSTNIPSYV